MEIVKIRYDFPFDSPPGIGTAGMKFCKFHYDSYSNKYELMMIGYYSKANGLFTQNLYSTIAFDDFYFVPLVK